MPGKDWTDKILVNQDNKRDGICTRDNASPIGHRKSTDILNSEREIHVCPCITVIWNDSITVDWIQAGTIRYRSQGKR